MSFKSGHSGSGFPGGSSSTVNDLGDALTAEWNEEKRRIDRMLR